jgi:hypothetical protein
MEANLKAPILKPGNVFLATITHSGHLDARMAQMFFNYATAERQLMTHVQPSSLLASACNNSWCKALNNREAHDLRWFALLHSDIVPEQWFLDKLIAIAEKHDADVLSAIVPIKEDSGVTSTALSGGDDFTRLTRLTMKQINHPHFPETFDCHGAFEALTSRLPDELQIPTPEEGFGPMPRLLVNTGCMVARLDREWSSRAYFTINDRIEVGPGGVYGTAVEPEDWFFSRIVAEMGGRVMATRALVVDHLGTIPYRSNKIWGKNIDESTLL